MMGIIAFCYNTKTATRYFTGVIPTKTSVWNYLAPAGLGLQSKPLRRARGASLRWSLLGVFTAPRARYYLFFSVHV